MADAKPWLGQYPEGVPAEIDAHPFENLNEMFSRTVAAHGDRIAFWNGPGHITYRDLGLKVRALSNFLTQVWGLRKGDKIAIVMPNLIQFPLAVFAALDAGLTVVNVNPLYTPREMTVTLRDSGATAAVVLSNFAYKLRELGKDLQITHILRTSVGDLMGWQGPIISAAAALLGPGRRAPQGCDTLKDALARGALLEHRDTQVAYSDTAFLQYTGGTTGNPKGAMLSHGNIIANIAQTFGMYHSRIEVGRELTLTPLPFYHVFALTINLMVFFYIGATNVLVTDPRRLGTVVSAFRRHPGISIMTGVNTLYNALLAHEPFRRLSLSSLKLVVAGGAAVQSGVDERFFRLTGTHILEGYGLTECSPLCCVQPPCDLSFNNSIGIPVPSTEARIVDRESGEPITALGQPGELEFRGPQVMQGYYQREDETEAAFHDGFLRTGDVAVWMEGGYIRLIDRIKDMILVSGFNVFPSEIEDVVSRNPQVAECAAVGCPSQVSGEAVKLYVVRRDPALTAEELTAYCRKYLTGYKMPRRIEFVRDLPKTPVGKVLRRTLKKHALAEAGMRGGL
ncbi:MAG: AMP-binding protein [Succinivibrionaceae bacterium]|nr:AMP-binding protein [Succinivibrionaceae bacterium]